MPGPPDGFSLVVHQFEISLRKEPPRTPRGLVFLLGVVGVLLRNTKFNAETAEPAEKNPLKLCDLCVLCVQTS